MRRMKSLLLALLLCGCASKVALLPPQVSTAEFNVTAFPSDMYLISYNGSPEADMDRLMDLALLKASQVAQQHQLKYFVIIDQANSKPGEVKYRAALPASAEWNKQLLIQGFKARPQRAFCFLSAATEQAVYEKLRTAPEPEPL